MAQRDRTETVVLLLVWALPMLAVTVLLLAVGLPLLAGALVVIEAVVVLLVLAADRPPRR